MIEWWAYLISGIGASVPEAGRVGRDHGCLSVAERSRWESIDGISMVLDKKIHFFIKYLDYLKTNSTTWFLFVYQNGYHVFSFQILLLWEGLDI